MTIEEFERDGKNFDRNLPVGSIDLGRVYHNLGETSQTSAFLVPEKAVITGYIQLLKDEGIWVSKKTQDIIYSGATHLMEYAKKQDLPFEQREIMSFYALAELAKLEREMFRFIPENCLAFPSERLFEMILKTHK